MEFLPIWYIGMIVLVVSGKKTKVDCGEFVCDQMRPPNRIGYFHPNTRIIIIIWLV